jgi:nucleolar protein 15
MPRSKSSSSLSSTRSSAHVPPVSSSISSSSLNFSDFEPLDETSEEEEKTRPKPNEADKEQMLAEFKARATSTRLTTSKSSTRGVLFVSHIPHGFYDEELAEFFGQFGVVTRLRLARSRKSGNSRGFAFIEFQHHEVAEIAAQAMNGYLMFGRSLVCELADESRIHPRLFDGADKKFRRLPRREIAREQINQPTLQQQAKRTERLIKREQDKKRRLEQAGINYDYEGFTKLIKQNEEKHNKKQEKNEERTEKKQTNKEKEKEKNSKKSEEEQANKQEKQEVDKRTKSGTKKSAK